MFHTDSLKISAKVSALALAVSLAFAAPAFADHHGHAIKAAVESPDRPAKDKTRDENRNPAAVLAFAGVAPGMTVLDINAGDGWYTEILSRTVGDDGKVYAQNGAVYWEYVKNDVAARYDGRLPNVVQVHDGHEEISLPENSVDVAMMVLAYHDYWYKHAARTQEEDITAILASIKNTLKPGGALVIVDHVGPAGSGTEAGDKYHRIDPELVKEQVEAAGFTLADTSDVLANPADDPTMSPFDPAIRGHTNRFIFKFVK